MYNLRASNFSDFRDLSRVAKISTHKFFELPITMLICIEYLTLTCRICNILGKICNVNNNMLGISIIKFGRDTKRKRKQIA